jgi:hypothetical protein
LPELTRALLTQLQRPLKLKMYRFLLLTTSNIQFLLNKSYNFSLIV